MSIEFILMGFLVGGLVGLTGVGGAALLTPFLIFIGINPSVAIGTDFVYNSITKLVGTIQHVRQKTVDFRLVTYLAMGSIPGAILSNLIVFSLLSDYYNKSVILVILGITLVIVSLLTMVHLFFNHGKTNGWKQKSLEEKRLLTIGSGFVVGIAVGATSVGSGSLIALVLLYFFNRKASTVVGTDITHAFLLVTVTGLMMIGNGHIDYFLVANLLCGSIPGSVLGSKLSKRVSSSFLQILMIVVILISGIKLIFI